MDSDRQRIADEVGGWVSELDACDAYVVLLGDPAGDSPLHAVGPYAALDALTVADRHGAGARVVRLHLRHPAVSQP